MFSTVDFVSFWWTVWVRSPRNSAHPGAAQLRIALLLMSQPTVCVRCVQESAQNMAHNVFVMHKI